MQELIKSKIKSYLHKETDITAAVVYGSLLTHNFKNDSDIDIGILCAQGVTPDLKLRLIQELVMLVGRPIDIVDLNEVHVPLLKEILVKGEFIKLPSPKIKEKLIQRMHDEVEDFLPKKRKAQITKLKRFIKNG